MGEMPRIMVCNCEKTMELDGKKIGKALGLDELSVHTNLCRREISRFEQEAGKGGELLIACTQEAPLFDEIIEEGNLPANAQFVNVRERAGWLEDKKGANEKIAALIKEATLTAQPTRLRSITSDGLCLVYGSGQSALEAAQLLSPRLSVTLVLKDASDVILPNVIDFAIYQGTLKSATGALGGFDVVVDQYAPLVPSSRGEPQFVMPKDGAKSRCSLILDLSGDTPVVSGHEKRDGYTRVDPGDPAALMRAIFDLSDLVGEFEKPIYVDYNAGVCAHSRNAKVGCSNCLDVCPAGAISPEGDLVHIDPLICGGCGSCHSVCPTGAISYNYPDRSDLLTRIFSLSQTYDEAGGKNQILLVHDDGFGAPLINALSRFGRGLPANVIPFAVHSPTVFGHTEILSSVLAGFAQIVFVCDPTKADELDGLQREVSLSEAILEGFGEEGSFAVSTDADPDQLEALLYGLDAINRPVETFVASGDKRTIARMAMNGLAKNSETVEPFALPENAPYGRVNIDLEACTLCMSCVSACPADAMLDTPDTPQLRFVEQACVQCSLCVKTCPEKALTLEPRLNWQASAMQPVTLKEEEPFECISCGTPFATQSTIKRVSEQLAGKHWMFEGDDRLKLLKMCGDCRIEAQAQGGNDPFAFGERPRIRTTEDYLESAKEGLSVDDFLIKN